MKTYVEQRGSFALTAADRCDRCAARAVVVTVMRSGGTLLWCAHHYGVNEAALRAGAAAVVRDERPTR
ncbi:DUF7455 domain-containing protein [Jatrophihabitans sp.]|uniref:DUF7455 domain-containing protein n=1 Tax=Jatrophihabitans sp. TaxID=1932789 RepID=UPI002EFA81A5